MRDEDLVGFLHRDLSSLDWERSVPTCLAGLGPVAEPRETCEWYLLVY